jgi:hypothetical protein
MFSYYCCLLIEGSGSGAGYIHLTNGSGSGSGRPKNMCIRIRNTDFHNIFKTSKALYLENDLLLRPVTVGATLKVLSSEIDPAEIRLIR